MRRSGGCSLFIALLCCALNLSSSAAPTGRKPPPVDPLEPARAALRTLQFQ